MFTNLKKFVRRLLQPFQRKGAAPPIAAPQPATAPPRKPRDYYDYFAGVGAKHMNAYRKRYGR